MHCASVSVSTIRCNLLNVSLKIILRRLFLRSNGLLWYFKIDKMDMHAVNFPCIYSQLATTSFKQGARIPCAINGSHIAGPLHSPEWHIRTLFEAVSHGSEMQLSTIMVNLLDTADREGHLPNEFLVGNDNTQKETLDVDASMV